MEFLKVAEIFGKRDTSDNDITLGVTEGDDEMDDDEDKEEKDDEDDDDDLEEII